MTTLTDLPYISIITLLHGEQEFIPLIKSNLNKFDYPQDKLELVIIDDGKESLISELLDDNRILYIHLDNKEIQGFLEKIDLPNDKEGILKNYLSKTRKLPNGFKRDYGVGLSSHDILFHMDYDTSYNRKVLTRKLKFIKKNKIDCVYNSSILCYDSYNKEQVDILYKSDNPFNIYEGTLLHTRGYWKNGGFKWSDISNEGRFFSDNHGIQRKMNDYYDSVKILSIRNYQEYKPIQLDLKQSEFKYELKKDIIKDIQINMNPIKQSMDELFQSINNIHILGIHSKFIDSLKESKYICENYKEKIKQKHLVKEIKEYNKNFNVLLFGYKQPIWSLFEYISFDCILLETHKNMEQMHSIIQKCKNFTYIYLNGIYINKNILIK